jgi:glc operon protein GlcG
MSDPITVQFIDEVARLFPFYVTDPQDTQWNLGNAVAVVIGPDGSFHGKIFGDNKEICQKCYQVGMRKVLQVWRTGHYTGKFEEQVYAGKLDENQFGVQRPDLIGWEGGVPLLTADGKRVAAAFSGFRGIKDIEILEKAAVKVGLRLKGA